MKSTPYKKLQQLPTTARRRAIPTSLLAGLALLTSSSLVTAEMHCDPDPAGLHEQSPTPLHEEHAAAFDLVACSDVTDQAVMDGDWDDPNVWGGTLPGNLARVLIPHGVSVTLDHENPVVHRTIRVDGTLRFAPDKDTLLRVDTMVTAPGGQLEIGTAANPIASNVGARISFADTGAIDLDMDPLQLGRGLVAHGRTTIHGESKTSHLELAQPVEIGGSVIELSAAPLNWRAGDLLILAGAAQGEADEIVSIVGVNGSTVTVTGADGMSWGGFTGTHAVPGGRNSFVMNMTRNVVFESENPDQADEDGVRRRRGHVMFMHGAQSMTDTRWMASVGMGRTDKSIATNNPKYDENGLLIDGTGLNPVGRYAWHFHRGGWDQSPAVVQGLAILGSPGLGLVNHSSHVEVSDSVAYDVFGSAFFTEVGDERGFFSNSASVFNPGRGEEADRGVKYLLRHLANGRDPNFGHAGHGFWLQGAGVTLHNVMASGSGDSGIDFYTAELPEPGISHDQEGRLTDQLPIVVDGALLLNSNIGLKIRFHGGPGGPEGGFEIIDTHSTIDNVFAAHVNEAVHIKTSMKVHMRDSTFLGRNFDTDKTYTGMGIRPINTTGQFIYENLEVRGFETGLLVPEFGPNLIIGGVYQNMIDINLSITNGVELDGKQQFDYVPEINRIVPDGRRSTRVAERIEIVPQVPNLGIPDGDEGSLRDLINQANTTPDETVVINLDAGVSEITILGDAETDDTRDYDVRGNIVIQGRGEDLTTIDNRVGGYTFHLHPGASLELRDLTIDGSGVFVSGSSELFVERVVMTNGSAPSRGRTGGAGVQNREGGIVTVLDSEIRDNDGSKRARGGAIHNRGLMYLDKVLMERNRARHGGGIYNAGDLTIGSVIIQENRAAAESVGLQQTGPGEKLPVGSISAVEMLIEGLEYRDLTYTGRLLLPATLPGEL